MSFLLLTVIYIAFIGLGLPDSIFGAAWPAIYQEFGLPFSYGSFISAVVYCGTMVSSLFSTRIIRRLGTYRITVVSTALTAAALLAFSFSGNLACLCLCAVPLGIGAGCIDTALNNYIALNYSAVHMNFLHCFYGIGITVSPMILSVVLAGDGGWRSGYRIAFGIQTMLAFLVLISFPLWKRRKNVDFGIEEEKIEVIPLKTVVTIPGVKMIWIIIIGLGAVESICNAWGATYLTEEKGMPPETAAGIIMFYYIGMTVGRTAAGIMVAKLGTMKVVILGEAVLCAALLTLLFSWNDISAAAGLFLIGLGNGPLFPNVSYLVPSLFGAEASPSIIGTQMAVGSLALMLSPVICGILGLILGMWILPLVLIVFYVFMAAATASVSWMRSPRFDERR